MMAPPTNAVVSRTPLLGRGPLSVVMRKRPDHHADIKPPITTPAISNRSQAVHGEPLAVYVEKYAFFAAAEASAAATTPEATLANAPDAPSPRPMITNAARRTSPNPTPVKYGSA